MKHVVCLIFCFITVGNAWGYTRTIAEFDLHASSIKEDLYEMNFYIGEYNPIPLFHLGPDSMHTGSVSVLDSDDPVYSVDSFSIFEQVVTWDVENIGNREFLTFEKWITYSYDYQVEDGGGGGSLNAANPHITDGEIRAFGLKIVDLLETDDSTTFSVSLYAEVVPVPEPATILFLGVGLLGGAGVGRIRHVLMNPEKCRP